MAAFLLVLKIPPRSTEARKRSRGANTPERRAWAVRTGNATVGRKKCPKTKSGPDRRARARYSM